MAEKSAIAKRTEQVALTNPNDIMDFATELKKMIVDKGLYSNIKGKNYVNVEGWQIAGAFTGTFPIVEKVEDLSDELVCKYRAEVSLVDKDGQKVGYGVAICSNKEPGKKGFDEYAIASMAQTRAVGKAYRMKIGWLLKVAGYETTPAEEMDAVEAKVVDQEADEIFRAKERLASSKDMSELKSNWYLIGKVRDHEDVIAMKETMKKKLEGGDNEQD